MIPDNQELLLLEDDSFLGVSDAAAWERQINEPHLWHQIFYRHFCLLGLTRTLKKAYASFYESRHGISLMNDTTISIPIVWVTAYNKWQWANRAAKFDEFVTNELSKEWTVRQEEQKQREWNVADRLLSLSEKTLARWTEEFEEELSKTGKFPKLRFVDIERILNLASRLGRLSSGLDTEGKVTKQEITIAVENIDKVRANRWAAIEDRLVSTLRLTDPNLIEGELVETT
jgi:hypothetical protein